MDSALALEILRVIGILAATAFGTYGIGAKTRNEDGSLRNAGRVAIAGLLTSLVFALTIQVIEGYRRAAAARAEALKLERLLRSSLYGSLGTQNARLDIRVQISIDDLTALDPAYARRLEHAKRSNKSCSVQLVDRGEFSSEEVDCRDFHVTKDRMFGTTLSFRGASSLLPSKISEPLAYALLNRTTVQLTLDHREESLSPYRNNLSFSLGEYSKRAHYRVENGVFEIEIYHQAINPDFLAEANFTSIVDVLGKKVSLTMITPLDACPLALSAHPTICSRPDEAFDTKLELVRFALTFPHRRDLVFQRSGGLLAFEESTVRESPRRKHYIYRYPESIEDLALADRQSSDRR